MNKPEKTFPESEGRDIGSSKIPDEAFLIIEGIRILPLIQAIISIGRRFENKIVIDDPRISRYHAQLRARDGCYELVDLNSLGGTYVNGNRITRSVLYSDDEISLAGIKLIYKQHDAPPRIDMKDTEPFSGSDSNTLSKHVNRFELPDETDAITMPGSDQYGGRTDKDNQSTADGIVKVGDQTE